MRIIFWSEDRPVAEGKVAEHHCASCGHENAEYSRYCTECGRELLEGILPARGPEAGAGGFESRGSASPAWQWPGQGTYTLPPSRPLARGAFTPPPWRWIPDRRDVDRTRNGLIVLAVAALVGLIPLVGPFAYFVLGLVGAVIVFAARSFFDHLHRTNVNRAVITWIIGFVVSIVGAVFAILIITTVAPRGPGALQSALSAFIDIILVTTVVSTFLFGLAWVLLPYRLVALEGRVFLWSAFALELGASFALAFLFRDELIASMNQAMTTGELGVDLFGGSVGSLQFLSVASAACYAIAYLHAARRVSRGDVHSQESPPPV